MVEVTVKDTRLRITVWRYLVVLFLMFLVALLLLWYLLGSQWGASSPMLESIRRYLAFINTIHPTTKPEDNFNSILRIHGVEKLGPKRFALFVTTTDKDGNPVGTIRASQVQLKIKDSAALVTTPIIDKVRPLHMYSWTNPISCSMVLDNSASMFPEDLRAIEDYYKTLVNTLIMPLQACVIKFSDKVNVLLQITAVKNKILQAVKKAMPVGNTALYDAIDKAVENIQGKPHLRFIILTTDGNDNASTISQLDALRRCKLHNISIFVLGFGWLDPDMLKTFSEETDGLYSYVPDSSKLKSWFKKLAVIINNVQVIEFSTASDMNLPKEVDLTIDIGGKKLHRKR